MQTLNLDYLNSPIKVTSRLGFCKTFYCIDKTLSSQKIEKSLRKKREKKSSKYKDIEDYSRPCFSVS
jgi:CRISPR/Cas system CSM-associated protein Csm4 (group 5 of RAMP superfamily)